MESEGNHENRFEHVSLESRRKWHVNVNFKFRKIMRKTELRTHL